MKHAVQSLEEPGRTPTRKPPSVIRLLRAWSRQSIESTEPWARVRRAIEKNRLSNRPAFDE